jgi:hypothetical protein
MNDSPQFSGKTRVDPELIAQVSAAATGAQSLVEAVIRVRPENPAEPAASPERTEEIARQLVERVGRETGVPAERVNVFRNLGTFAVAAPPEFVKALYRQPEVASAMANRPRGRALIPPVAKRPASIEDVGKERRTARTRKTATAKRRKSGR